jgi:hypothetical protein
MQIFLDPICTICLSDLTALTQQYISNKFSKDTSLAVEISLQPCVTSARSFNVVPTYTNARVIGC